jgi:hypothetical protein
MTFRSLVSPLAVALTLVLAGTAQASTVNAPNACRYSYDGFFRNTGVSLTGTGTVVAAAADPSASDAADVVPGQKLTLDGATLHFAFPEEMIRFGYTVGLLTAGPNTITVRGWVAIKGTNTKEGTQLIGPLDVTATTTIVADAADDGRFVSATPLSYTDPVLPATTWGATGGDVAFSQAGEGALPALPIGTGGAARVPLGSAVIQTNLNGANFVMDCVPGAATDVNPTDNAGPGYAPTPAAAFSTVAGPLNVTCLDSLGHQASGAAANLPNAVTRELNPIGATLSASGAPATYTVGTAYVLTGAQAHLRLGADTVATLGRFDDGGSPLITADHAYPLKVWVTLAASNTAEGTQTVAATATYTLHPSLTPVTATSAWDPATVVADLPATTWTPTGAGPISFSTAQPGSMPALDVVGPATGGPGGPVDATSFRTSPYGALLLRGDTEANPIAFDCVAGAITLANDAIAWSNLGRLAPLGRYALDVPAKLPAFQTATDSQAPAPGDNTPPPPGDTTPPPSQVPGPPAATPKPATTSSLIKLTASALKADRKGRVKLTLSCGTGILACTGKLDVKTASKVRVGKRSKVLTVVTKRAVETAAGKRATLTLKLTSAARNALKRHATLTVVVTFKPDSGKAVTKRVKLRR